MGCLAAINYWQVGGREHGHSSTVAEVSAVAMALALVAEGIQLAQNRRRETETCRAVLGNNGWELRVGGVGEAGQGTCLLPLDPSLLSALELLLGGHGGGAVSQ